MIYRRRNDPTQTMESVSAGVIAVTGYQPEDFTSGRILWNQIQHPDDVEWTREAMRQAAAERRMFHLEYRIHHRDGSERWVSEQGEGVINGDRLVAFEGFVADVTGDPFTEPRTALLSAIVESSADAIVSKDLNGIIQTWNMGAEMIFGYSAKEAIGQPITILIPPGLADEEQSILERVRRGERISHFETIRRRKDGTLLDISLTISPIVERGRIVGASKIARDITERKQASAAVARLAAIVESSDDAIISKDLNGIIQSWNHGAERIFGYRAHEVIGQSIMILIPAEQADEEPAILDRIRRGDRTEHYETIRRRKDGSLVDISLSVSPIINQQGHVTGASKIARDISERKRMERDRAEWEQKERRLAVSAALQEKELELARISRALTVGELAASIAHEVNQPLGAIVTNAEAGRRWLAAESPNLEEVEQSLSLIVRDGIRASEIVRRIRAFLKKDKGETELVDVNAVIGEAISFANSELSKRQIHLRTELSPHLPNVRGDRIQLQQVILNLIVNGRDSMMPVTDRPKELVVNSRQSVPDRVQVAVQDCGCGATREELDRMFDPFFTTKADGLGMGLPICRSIVEAHGGRIWATENEGAGLTVQFDLPADGGNLA